MKRKTFKVKRERSTSTSGHYIPGPELLKAVKEAKLEGKVSDKLISMISTIADRYSMKSSFSGYSFREDMVSAAVENLCRNALKFNTEKYDNPFAYYTMAIHRSFLQYMSEEKKHRILRDKLLIDAGANPSFNFLDTEKDESDFHLPESDDIVIDQAQDDETDSEQNEKIHDAPAEPLEAAEEVPVKKTKIQYRDRIPSAVIRYGPEDIEIDPITGAISIKSDAAKKEQQISNETNNASLLVKEEKPKRKSTIKKSSTKADTED